jgi:hypothetical protein
VIYLGIDPGVTGGIAFVDEHSAVVNAVKMPESDRDLYDLFTTWPASRLPTSGIGPWRAVIERVHASPQMGVSSAFTFGKGFGRLLMALTAAAIPFDEVSPRKWQPAMGVLYPKESTQTERKNISKARAQQLFPGLTVTHAIADALLIAEYNRRSYNRQQVTGELHGKDDTQGRETPIETPRRIGSLDYESALPPSEDPAAAGHGRHGASQARAVRGNRRRHSASNGRPARV